MTLARANTPSVGLGLFTCADSVGQNQFNAWSSWKEIPGCSVSVFGNAPGIADHAHRFGFRPIPTVKRDEFGRPLLNSIFAQAHEESSESVLGYVNSDIILLPGLAASIAAVQARFEVYLLVARRWNVQSLPAIDFEANWAAKLRSFVAREGELFTPFGIDLFVFSRGLLREIPAFALGSDYWDNYLLMQTRRRGVPVIDVTQQVMLVHQNHPLGKYRSAAERRRGPEGLRALALAGDSHAMLGQTADATHVLEHGEVKLAETAHVTVVLPQRGEPRRLCRCLRALEHQTYPQSFLNAIVVNNDPEAPLRYLEADFPSVRVVNEARFGVATARNKGISCAQAEVIALFDSEVVPATDCLERALRTLKTQPECQVVVCRMDPHFRSGKVSYLARAVEWFDVVIHYDPKDWLSYSGASDTGALIIRKELFGRHGYFRDFCPGAASDNWEWVRRMIAAGVQVAFCREAFVRHETVSSVAELKRKKQRAARGDCVLESLEQGKAYGVAAIVRCEWSEFCRRVSKLRKNQRIPARYRAGVLFLAVWAAIWALNAKLQFRHEAERVVRRRRRAAERAASPSAHAGSRRTGLPFRWLGARVVARRLPSRGPSQGSADPSTCAAPRS